MPEIARFLGIMIRMYVEIDQKHNCPHFHAYYQGGVAIYNIETIELISGELPTPSITIYRGMGGIASRRFTQKLGTSATWTSSR